MNILKILDVECLARTWKRRLDAAILANSHVSRQNKNILCCLLCIYIYDWVSDWCLYIYIYTCVCVCQHWLLSSLQSPENEIDRDTTTPAK